MTHSVGFAELPEWLAMEMGAHSDTVAVLAGHYAIFSAGGVAVDLLDGRDAPPPGAAEMLEFTRLSWEVACTAARAQPDSLSRFVVLVDDIQFVRPVTYDRSTAERLAVALVRDYFDEIRHLPAWHAERLAGHGLGTERVFRRSQDGWLFSERDLRQSAVRHLRECLADGGAHNGLSSTDNGNSLTVTLPEQGDYCLVHSGHTSCAGGYVELLSTLYQRGIRKLIAFVPMRCLGQVALGTALAQQLFAMPGFEAVNVAIPDVGTASAATIVAGP